MDAEFQKMAARIARLRRSHKEDRDYQPEGEWDDPQRPIWHSEKKFKFYPSDREWCSCCSKIKRPSKNAPWSLWYRCLTKRHAVHLIKKHGMASAWLLEQAGMSENTGRDFADDAKTRRRTSVDQSLRDFGPDMEDTDVGQSDHSQG